MSNSSEHHQSLASHSRTARIAISGEDVAGVCIFLNEEDLRTLDITPDEVCHVLYTIDVENHQLAIEEPSLSEVKHGMTDQ
jgi:hypothetical protein